MSNYNGASGEAMTETLACPFCGTQIGESFDYACCLPMIAARAMSEPRQVPQVQRQLVQSNYLHGIKEMTDQDSVREPGGSDDIGIESFVDNVDVESFASPVLKRLLEEVRQESGTTAGVLYAYDRIHNRHNRGR